MDYKKAAFYWIEKDEKAVRMQITGTTELVESWTGEYMDLLAFKKIFAENLKSCRSHCAS